MLDVRGASLDLRAGACRCTHLYAPAAATPASSSSFLFRRENRQLSLVPLPLHFHLTRLLPGGDGLCSFYLHSQQGEKPREKEKDRERVRGERRRELFFECTRIIHK